MPDKADDSGSDLPSLDELILWGRRLSSVDYRQATFAFWSVEATFGG
jgi:hypothetical protein